MTTAATKGLKMGWTDARTYATGTRTQRAAIRRRLVKASLGYTGEFWGKYREYASMALCDFATAIEEGRMARTCRPSKLRNLMDRCDAEADRLAEAVA